MNDDEINSKTDKYGISEALPKIKFNQIVDDIMRKKILLKLKKNITILVDGKILKFSDLMKQLCSSSSFNYRLTLETISRENFLKIIEFIDIIEWNKQKYMFDIKAGELNNWYENNFHIMSNLEEVNIQILTI